MADDDSKTRPTRPPPEEDSPPGVYRPVPPSLKKPEPIARVALRAPRASAPELRPEEETAQQLAQLEGNVLGKMSDWQQGFEERFQEQIAALVAHEISRSLPPPPPLPALSSRPPKKRFQWSDLQYIAPIIVALTGLIGVLKPLTDAVKRIDAIEASSAQIKKDLEQHLTEEKAHRQEIYEQTLASRSWMLSVLNQLGVRVIDPPGTPPHPELEFYPAPKLDPHKITAAHPVQPKEPYPVPPPP